MNPRTVSALEKKKINTVTELARYFPRKYLDYREIYSVIEAVGKDVAVCGYIQSVAKKSMNQVSLIEAEAIDPKTGQLFYVKWIGQSHLYEIIAKLAFKEIVFCGKTNYDERYGYSISNPFSFSYKETYKGKIVPVYTKIKGVSDENLRKLIEEAIKAEKEPLPEDILTKTKLLNYQTALRAIHHPKTMEDIENGRKRIIFNDVLYFCIRIRSKVEHHAANSPFSITSLTKTMKFIADRPFALTDDQRTTVETIWGHMKDGTRANALVQGDVGCGKTMVAFASMFAMAENGYQSCIMTPTAVLASQHYKELSSLAVEYGFRTAYLSSELTKTQKKKIIAEISAGNIDFVVGTHSVITEDVVYKNLGLVVTDEEHRFGVNQKDALEQKAGEGAHVISMSATPIPRTIADVLYGEDKELYTIKTLPNGRKPVQTAINNSEKVIFEFLEKQISAGRQGYVVCPLIETNEEREGVHSLEETSKLYNDYFGPRGVKIAVVNGKMKKAETDEIIARFKNKEYDILLSTTVIEVGVNVPNANVIIINNAELFGLAQLHQLRGRVGRGDYQSYCILRSSDKENPRLNVMVKTTDGFEIANEDLKLRGIGDLLGTKQSGDEHYAELIMAMPNLYVSVKKYADWITNTHREANLLKLYEETMKAA